MPGPQLEHRGRGSPNHHENFRGLRPGAIDKAVVLASVNDGSLGPAGASLATEADNTEPKRLVEASSSWAMPKSKWQRPQLPESRSLSRAVRSSA